MRAPALVAGGSWWADAHVLKREHAVIVKWRLRRPPWWRWRWRWSCGAVPRAAAAVQLGSPPSVRRRRGLLPGFLVHYNLIHVVTHGFNRYRLPVMPVFLLAAA
jgi:hypothetical protein